MPSPHLDEGVPSVLVGDLNFAQKPGHRYYFQWPHTRTYAVAADEVQAWRALVGLPGNFLEAPGDNTHSCVHKSCLCRGNTSGFYAVQDGGSFGREDSLPKPRRSAPST